MSIRLVSLYHRFGHQSALEDVSIHLRSGDCYGLVGHNGAGKTTAMRIALGLISPTEGRVIIDGFDARRHPREARMLTGAMIETPAFYRDTTGRTNLIQLARVQGMSRTDAAREADRVLELVGLRRQAGKRFGAYSQGMKQRLGLAQALLGNPAYLLLDEPTNGLDPEGVADVRRLLLHLVRDEERTVLISSHQLQELSGMCNRIGVLREGRLLVEKTITELLAGKGNRYEVRTDDDDNAAAVLVEMGLTLERDERIRVDLAQTEPNAVARALVTANVGLRAFTPRPPDLEEVYLHWAGRGNEQTPKHAAKTADAIEVTAPTARAPRWPALRTFAHDLVRSRLRLALLALPAIVAIVSVRNRHARAEAIAQQAADEGYFGTMSTTAFEAVGWALDAALPLLVVLAAGIASQAIAGERSRGTLRHLMLRPVRRVQLAAGKAGAVLAIALAGYVALIFAATLAAGTVFDYGNLAELLLTGETYEIETATAELMRPRLLRVLLAPVLPLCAYAGIGFLAGALMRSATAALAVALSAVVVLDLLRVPARGYDVDAWLPASHLPSIIGDASSYIHYYIDTAQGASDAMFRYGGMTVLVPCVWFVTTFLLAGLVTAMRTEQ